MHTPFRFFSCVLDQHKAAQNCKWEQNLSLSNPQSIHFKTQLCCLFSCKSLRVFLYKLCTFRDVFLCKMAQTQNKLSVSVNTNFQILPLIFNQAWIFLTYNSTLKYLNVFNHSFQKVKLIDSFNYSLCCNCGGYDFQTMKTYNLVFQKM